MELGRLQMDIVALQEMRLPAIEERRRALAACKACPLEYNLQVLQVTQAKHLGRITSLLKCCKETITTELYEIFCLCWREGGVPQDMKDANIVILYKNKGDRGNCNNYPQDLFSQRCREAACLCHAEEAPGACRQSLSNK